MKEQIEKQAIEEMACAMCGQDEICGGVGVEKCIIYPDYRRKANRLYNAGYRKQIEGKWEKRTAIIFDSELVGYRCAECNTTWDTPTNYCPNCGAKMGGGAE